MHMKQKTVYTPNWSFDCKRPLGWDEITKELINAVHRYNQAEKKKWEKNFFLRMFWHPNEYKVETQATGNSETIKLNPETYHHQIWIENIHNKRMHFDIMYSNGATNSKFLQDGVKYKHFIIITEDTSAHWLDKKHIFMYKFLPFINYEVL